MSTHRAIINLASRLTKVEQDASARNQPQLAASSVEDGAITHYDATGQLTAVIGAQHDGTTAPVVTAGPVPPEPTGLDVTPGQLTVTASWAGTFSGGAVAPMDFSRVEVHRGYTSDFVVDTLPTSATRVGTIEAPGGGSFTWSEEPGDVWVTLVTRAQSGKASDSQEIVQVTVIGAVDPDEFDQLNADLKASAQTIATAQAAADAAADEAKNGQIDGARIIDGTLVADRVIVPGTVGATMIADGAITTPKIAVNSIDATKIIAASISGDKLIANTITGDKIAANTIKADSIDAASIGAAVGDFTFIKADNIKAGNITANIGMATTGQIIAGDVTTSYAKMDSTGFTTWLVAPDGTQVVGTALGSSGANALTIADSSGNVTGAISPDGVASLSDLDVDQDPSFMGRPLFGKRVDPDADDGILDDAGRGVVGMGDFRSLVSGGSIASQEATLGILTISIDPGRMYQIVLPYAFYVSQITSGKLGAAGVNFYITSGDSPDDPTNSDKVLGLGQNSYAATLYNPETQRLVSNFASPATDYDQTAKILITANATDCTMAFSVTDSNQWKAWVFDMGQSVQSTARVAKALPKQTTSTGGSTTTASNVVPKQTFTSTWHGDASTEYTGAGAVTPSRIAGGYIRHGNAGGGNIRSVISFNSAAVDGEKRYMSTCLSGATITKAEVFVKFKMWYTSSGGTAALHPLKAGTAPSALPDSAIPSDRATKQYTAANQGYWIQVPTSWFSSSSRGVIIGPATSSSFSNYGYYYGPSTGAGDRVKLRLTYTR